jgi:UDP-2,3-diacylglucosamine pyrophosphatase LpxH
LKHYKTIIISDVHLGTAGAKAEEVAHFLMQHSCDVLILNGDIIDGWELKNYGSWQVKHTRFFKVVLRMIEHYNTKVIYLHGNHDDFLDNILPLTVGNLSLQMDYIHESAGQRYYVVHGDIFDTVTTRLKWVAKLGSIGYTVLLWLNKGYNAYRRRMGRKPYSFSQYIKSKVKSAVSPAKVYEQQLTELARLKGCHGIICGHTHKPAVKQLGDVMYMNSGDWVESMTALVEDFEGKWELYRYQDHHQVNEAEQQDLTREGDEIDQMKSFYANIASAALSQKNGKH